MKTWKREKIDMMKRMYGKRIDAYGACHDDRRVYANTYHMIMEALSELSEDPPVWLKAAVNAKLKEEMKVLDRIARHFDSIPA